MNKITGDASVFIGIGMIVFILVAGLAMVIPIVNYNIKTNTEREITEVVYAHSNLQLVSTIEADVVSCWEMRTELANRFDNPLEGEEVDMTVDDRPISSVNRDVCGDGKEHIIVVDYKKNGYAGTEVTGEITYKLGVA